MISTKILYKIFPIIILLTPALSTAEDNCIDDDGDGWGTENGVSCQANPVLKVSKYKACKDSNSDKDGDGWGWENKTTCISKSNSLYQYLNYEICSKKDSDPDKDGWGWENNSSCISRFSNIPNLPAFPECDLASSDTDKDGWGWEDGISCRVKIVVAEENCKDNDGDGWGWNENTQTSCQTLVQEQTPEIEIQENVFQETEGDSFIHTVSKPNTPISSNNCVDDNGDGWGWDGTKSCEMPYVPTLSEIPKNLGRVTDVIVSAGQSNALGENSKYDENMDGPHPRVLVWSMEHGWQTANLKTQVWWTKGTLTKQNPFGTRPKNFGKGQNHGGFQIAKAIAESDPKKVVAFISTGDPGKPISNWDSEKEHYKTMTKTVSKAMAALPNKKEVDLVWLMQGESDSRDTPIYEEKLYNLIDRLRSEPWYSKNGYFIANETARFEINKLFRRLDGDHDPKTCFSFGQGLPTEKDGVHFKADAFRQIGKYVSKRYLTNCAPFKAKRINLFPKDEDLWTKPYIFKEDSF